MHGRRTTTIEVRCGRCGYGAIVRVAPETCPMCHGTVWDPVATIDADGERLHDLEVP
jgi:hypothetical protein